MIVVCDTREQRPPPFPEGVTLERRTLAEADYTTPALIEIARIERKSVSDFASTISHGRERFDREVQRLQSYRWKCIVVEGDISEIPRVSGVHPHAVIGTIASLYARHDLPVLFSGADWAAGRLIAGLLRRWDERVMQEAA